MTQGELEQIPQGVEKILRDLEIRIMDDIVRRIRINGFSTASADWQLTRLQQLGESSDAVKEWVRQALDASDEEIERIYSDTVYEEYMKHGRAYEAKGVAQIPYEDNIPLRQLIEGVKRQTAETFQNISGSMGFVLDQSGERISVPLSQFYTKTLDAAVLDIQSGAFSYNEVLKRTINDMTRSGLRWIDYESGWHNRVPVAARRAVMTGFRQVQGHINEQTAAELGTDSYEVTVHIGARPSHAEWEGKVYTMEELHSICGLGEVTGLHGANCYHDYNAFIPGVSTRTYTDEQLDRIHAQGAEKHEYNGKEYNTYEALQHQRKMETAMRAQRQKIHLMETGEADETDITLAKAKYKGQMATYKDFSKEMELPTQVERITQDGLKVNQDIYVNERLSDQFIEYNNGQKDVITLRKLRNNLAKTEVGKETLLYLEEHPEITVNMCYNVDKEQNLLGQQIGNDIYIYASDTKTVQKTAETIVHEVTHHMYGIGGTQKAEVICFVQEYKHKMGRSHLTVEEIKRIIKNVKMLYPEFRWR